MEQHFQQSSSVDYSLKEGETIVLQIKNVSSFEHPIPDYVEGLMACNILSCIKIYPFWCQQKPGRSVKSKFFEQGLNNLSLEEKGDRKEPLLSIRPPPPPPAPLSPATSVQSSPSKLPEKITLDGTSTDKAPNSMKESTEVQHSSENESTQDIPDDDFGDFQAAG